MVIDDPMIDRAVSALREGKVVAAATETFFGLLADIRKPAAIDRVFALKGRASDKGSALLLPSFEAWEDLVVAIPELGSRLAHAFWPGPLTIALAAKPGLDPRLVVNETVAVRLPSPSPAAALVRAFGSPLTATSANRTGEPPFMAHEDVEMAFAAEIARGELLVLPGHSPGGAPSTLVVVEDDDVRLVRKGAISVEAVGRVVGRPLRLPE